MTIREAQSRLLFQLYDHYDNSEAAQIADWVMERITGWKRIDRIVNRDITLSAGAAELFEKFCYELSMHRPVQYVLNEAWFGGLRLYVNEQVLIPRPETEELAAWVLDDFSHREKFTALDIGTGSGCLAILIAKKSAAEMYALDISAGALEVAARNAAEHQAVVQFVRMDILDEKNRQHLPQFDCIVSNPPYIPEADRDDMKEHVLRYEPELALFAGSEDPLIFYRAIARFSVKHLVKGGMLYLETHEHYAEATAQLFCAPEFSTAEIRKDLQGKNRMVRITK